MLNKFGQMKDLYALKKQADEMKKKMEKVVVTVAEGDYEIKMRGDQTIESVTSEGEDRNDLKKLFNKAVKESQKMVAKKMRGELGGLGIPGL
ncbi:hypothetical protein CO178_01040 [candidate division WWE3 bacterium CG_4_9_14_3_um_filter_34_6]|uniref:Nucleoid-associated protein, YbaB/EbfC family n=1 Tax=candidate division WWE3 bacterium CG_4_9_14_3_um_filter_34_6 TaxID=1975079 RepID=A0A2M7X4D8_UNCKA|nr:MAG: hypothetical protein CO178_01040 [candidate division WWE3 bacterium CG_4_9_14_3_um_filter_34_6]